jgi:hypothetical protein
MEIQEKDAGLEKTNPRPKNGFFLCKTSQKILASPDF